jgi:hypothetical protein
VAGEAAVNPVKLPGAIGETLTISGIGAVEPPQDEPFRVGDVFTIGPFKPRYKVTKVDGDRVDFERIS